MVMPFGKLKTKFEWGKQAQWRDWQTDVPLGTWSKQMYSTSYTMGTYWKW